MIPIPLMWAATKTFLGGVPKEVWYALGAALLIWLAYDWAYDRGAASQEAKTQATQVLLDTALVANKTNMDTIDALKAANTELAEGREADKQAADKAVATLAKQRDRLESDLAKAKRNRSRIYANNPEAAAVGATVVPDSLVDSLRDSAD